MKMTISKRNTRRFLFLTLTLIGFGLLWSGATKSTAQQSAPLTFQISTVDGAGTAKSSFYLGEPAFVLVSVTNASAMPQTITTLDQAPISLSLSARINGEEGPVVHEGLHGGRFAFRSGNGVEYILQGTPADITLAPGQRVDLRIDLAGTFGIRLDDGSYTLKVVYSPAIQAQADFTIAIDEPRTIPVLEQMVATGNESDQRWANSYLDLIRKPSISGRVTNPAGGPVGGVRFSITGAQTTNLSNLSDGTYRLTQLTSGGNYTLTPSLDGYTFAPATRAFNNLTAKQVDVNFTATKVMTGENVALAKAGAVATASSTFDDDYPADSVINGFTYGDWGTGSGGWMDGTPSVFADSIEIDFGGPKGIDWINVYTLQDNFQNSSEPTLTETFTLYGITGFDVQYWNGSAWVNVPGGQVDGNNKVWRQFTFPTITTSKIKVNVRTAQGGQSRITEIQAFHTNKPPTVSIPGTYQGAPGAAIQFASTAADVDGSIQSYNWDFGDNTSGTGPSPSHTYAAAGTYTATLTVTDDTGQTATATNTVTIAGAPQSPVAAAGGPYTGFPGTSIIFDGRGSFDPDGTIVSYQWNFGDGASAPGAAPSHSYAQSGNYAATLVVTDNSGSTATQSANVTIAIAVPIVTMTAPANGTVVLVGSTVRLIASVSSADPISSVQFFQGTTLLGNGTLVTPATTPPTYFFDWTNVPAGNYTITAKATKVGGGVGTSAPVNLTVSAPPTVSITAPVNNATFAPPASITVTANAAASNGNVSKVEFFQGATKIGEDTSAPYSTPWNNVASGSYQLTAKVTDSNNFTATSAAVTVVVNTLPTVSITSPTVGQSFNAPANVAINVVATDADGSISKVEIYQGATLLGEATFGIGSNLFFNWMNVAAGNYSLTAKATDNRGAVTTSAAVNVIVNAAPTVAITAPANNAMFTPGENIQITTSASDSDGSISKVEIYQGTTLLGQASSGINYIFVWTNVAAGTYTLTAKATDNRGAVTTSAPINIIVNAPPTVAITALANNATFAPGENIQMTISASDTGGGSISKVEIYQGATLLGQASSGINYIFVWTNVAAGTYTLTAKATDNNGAVTTSAPISVTVNDPAPPANLVFGDDFNDNTIDVTKWTVVSPSSTAVVSEQGQRLQIALPPHEAAYNGISSNAAYDLRGKTVQLELAQAVSQAGWVENYLQVILDSQNYYLINVGAGSLLFRSMVNGANDQTSIGFDPAAARYWRIRHDATANTINFETSPNAVTWTTQKTVTPGFSLAAVKFNLMSGAWGTGNNTPGTAKYDNFQLTGVTSPNSATFVQIDDETQGNWNDIYGSGGYSLAHPSGDMTSLPSAEMSMTGQTALLWALGSSDPRALAKPYPQKGRIIACWYSATNFTIDLNLTDNLQHQVALYGLDWDGGNRSIRVEVIDATTNAVLDTRDLTAYSSGAYMVWNLKGHLRLRVTKLAGTNAAISGIFID
jgi:PKD repeat protein